MSEKNTAGNQMSIFHKAMLSGAVQMCGAEDDPQLQLILLEPTGEVVALNRWAIYAAAPVPSVIKTSLSINTMDKILAAPVVVSRAQIELLVKNIPADKQFKSLLEHVSITNRDGNVLNATFNDGRGERSMSLRSMQTYPALSQWQQRFQALGKAVAFSNFVYNRARLEYVMSAIGAACKYSGEFDYIAQQEFEHGFIWKTKNGQLNQVILIAWVCSTASPEVSLWEQSLLIKPTALLRPKRTQPE
jgi:hypothetical protein